MEDYVLFCTQQDCDYKTEVWFHSRPYGPQMNNSELVQMVEEMLGPEAAAFFIPNTMTEKESQAMMDFSLSWIARHPMDAHLVTKVLLLWNKARR